MPKNLGLYKDDLSTPRKKDVDTCYGPNNAPPYPVTSVSGKTGAVTLSASDVGAVPTLTYEWNKQLACGSNGLVCLGKFPCYDTNITIDIDSTTSETYHGTLVIATQNINTTGGGRLKATVYGDATGTLSSVIKIQYGSGSNVVSVYCSFPGWSKNLVHVRAVALASTASDVLTKVTSIPTEANRTATNALTSKYLPLSGGTITGTSGNAPLELKSASSSSYVGFVNTSGTTLGYVGYSGTSSPAVYTDKAYKIYHEGNKPKASDVGLGNVDNVKQYSANNPPPYPVTSVNSKSGAVTLSKGDVGLSNVDNVKQYSSTNPPPYPVTSVSGKTGAVTLTKANVGLGNVDNVKQYSESNPPPYPVTSVNGQTGDVTIESGGVAIVTQSTQPSGQKTGDFWYQVT